MNELTDEQILAIVKAGPALNTAEDEWLHITRAIIAADRAQRQAEPGDYDTWMKNPYTLVLNNSIAEDYVPRHVQERQAGQELVAWRDAIDEAIIALENSGWTRNRDASLTTLRQALAAPQPASQLDKDAEIAALKAQLAGFARGVKISIPTETMEQEFQQYYKRGLAAGLAQAVQPNED